MSQLNDHQLELLVKALTAESNVFDTTHNAVEKLQDEREKARFRTTTIDDVVMNFSALEMMHGAIEDILSGDPTRIQGATEYLEIFDKGGNMDDLKKWMDKWGQADL